MIVYNRNANWQVQFTQLKGFLSRWYGALSSTDGVTRTQVTDQRIPPPLRSLYQVAGNKKNLTTFNRLLMPWEVRFEDGTVIFCEEAQRVCWWSTLTSEENPPVTLHQHHARDRVQVEDEKLCGFLYQFCVAEAIEGAALRYLRAAFCELREIESILRHWMPAPLSPWRWPRYPTTFYSTEYALAKVTPGPNGTMQFECAARTSSRLSFMEAFVSDSTVWESLSCSNGL